MIRTTTIIILLLSFLNVSAQLPTGFADQLHSDGWNSPTGVTFDANGKMYVWEKDGRVYHAEANNTKTLLLDISEEVATYGDYGLLGFALDPNYINNGYIYLYYIVDRHHLLFYGTQDYNPFANEQGATIARVTRYTVANPASPAFLDANSRLVLIGESLNSGFPITGTNHAGGGMAFGNDGTLFIGCGDGGLGDDYSEQARDNGILTQAEYDIERPYRCQVISSLNGKIVRINPTNGDGLSDNPFYDNNNARSPQSRVWSLGLRNPFRFTVKPNAGNPGVLYVGDVGWNDREELNIVTNAGQNFGWPLIEGIDLPTFYVDPTYYPANPKTPTVEWRGPTARVVIHDVVHEVGSPEFSGDSFTGTCSIGGVWYTGTNYPEEFRNTYMFADFFPGWLKSFSFDNDHNPTSFRGLLDNIRGIVCMAYNPADQSIYYVKMGFNEGELNEVRKIAYNPSNIAPVADFTYNPTYGSSPLTVFFDASLSTDYENSALTYAWDFGDGNTENGVNVSHTFNNNSSNPQKYDVILTVTDAGGLSNTKTASVSLNNTPPIINSTSVDVVNYFGNSGNDLIQLTAQTSDNEEPSNQLTNRWVVRLYHDSHSHPELDVTSTTSQVNLAVVPCDGHTYFYRVILIVTDSYGLSTTFSKDIYPNCSIADTTPPEIPFLKSYENTSNSFKLSWNSVSDNVGVNSYEVFINGASQGVFNSQTISYQYASASSIENQVFQCYVKAKDYAGNESVSSKLNFTHINNIVVGPSVYLSDLPISGSTNFWGPIEIDMSNGGDLANDGQPLTLNGIVYSKGLGMHAASEIIYNIPSNTYNTFSTKIGIDDEISDGNCGSMMFQIFKNNLLAYESPIMYPNSSTITVELDISNTSELKLVGHIASNLYYCDHGDWADAKLYNANNSDTEPPSTPLNLSVSQQTGYFQASWNASTDNTDTNIEYEIVIDDIIYATTSNLQAILPSLAQGNHTITVQAKDDGNNRAVSSSIVVTYGACPSNIVLSSPTDNFSHNTVSLKVSQDINASNTISGDSNVVYQAANKIELLPGFKVEAGSVFKTTIAGCSN